MRTLIVKILLLAMTVFIFGAFQYGGVNTPSPFQDSWQSWFAGIGMAIAIVILFQEILVRIKVRVQ